MRVAWILVMGWLGSLAGCATGGGDGDRASQYGARVDQEALWKAKMKQAGVDIEPTAESLGSCPFGHRNLKQIPVVNGLLLWTPELRRQADNLEFWWGGCCGMERTKVICLDCRYAYEPWAKVWEKHSPNPKDLGRTVDEMVTGFVGPADGQVTYFQAVRGDKTIADRVIIWTHESFADCRKRMADYLAGKRIPRAEIFYQTSGSESVRFESKSPGDPFLAEIKRSASNDRTSISLEKRGE